MSDVKSISGKGFFTTSGDLKSAEQLASDVGSSGASEKSTLDLTDSSSRSITNALGAVRGRFLQQANNVISSLNTSDSSLKQAHEIVRDQIASAKKLKTAIKDGDADAESAARDELSDLQEKRTALAKEIEKNNAASIGDRDFTLNLGSEQKAKIEVAAVQFSAGDSSSLASADQVDTFIDGLKDDARSVKQQRAVIKDSKSEVGQTVSAAQKELNAIEKDGLTSFESAAALSEKLAGDIKSAGAQAFLSNSLNESVTRALLS